MRKAVVDSGGEGRWILCGRERVLKSERVGIRGGIVTGSNVMKSKMFGFLERDRWIVFVLR